METAEAEWWPERSCESQSNVRGPPFGYFIG